MTAPISPRPAIRPEIFALVRDAVAESLMIEPGAIALESGLIDELGADSLDFVEIVFMLDRELDIRVRESEFNFLTRLDFSSPTVMREGFLTAEVIDRLRDWLPALATVPDATRVTPRQLFSLLTVESICIVAQRRVDARANAT
jgi:acyl carrier protein